MNLGYLLFCERKLIFCSLDDAGKRRDQKTDRMREIMKEREREGDKKSNSTCHKAKRVN